MRVSVVIPTYSEAQSIGRVLDEIPFQTDGGPSAIEQSFLLDCLPASGGSFKGCVFLTAKGTRGVGHAAHWLHR
jgi:hypothetical protein